MTFLLDERQLKHDLREANGDRVHGRLKLNDLDEARHQRADQEFIVVVGKPATSDPNERVTLVVMIPERGRTVAHAEEATVSDAEHVKTFTMNHIDYFFPDLVSHLKEILYHLHRP
jgi:hypothetical protein